MIFKEVAGINRCIWNLGPRMPSRARPLAATVTAARLDLLREADALVMDGLRRHGLYRDIWQCPTVLVPLEIDGSGREFVIVRPIHSERAMTATPARLPRGAARRTAARHPLAARRERPRAGHHARSRQGRLNGNSRLLVARS